MTRGRAFRTMLLATALALGCAGSPRAQDAGPDLPIVPDAGIADDAPAPADLAADLPIDLPADEGAQPLPWPTCPQWGEGALPLREKAAFLDALVPSKHLDDDLLRSLRVDADGNVTSRDHLPSTGLWTAMYLASQSFRYAVTGAPEAVENARVAVRGLHHLTAVTGIPGLYGRAYQRPGVAYTWDASASASWVASDAPGYEGWYWNHDVSKDTMDGILFGYAAALEFLKDPEILDIVRKDVLAFAEAFVGAGLQIIDHTGRVTEHGRLFYSAMDDFPGFNALLSLSWVRTALAAGGGPDLVHFYEDCLLRLGDHADCPVIDPLDIGSYLDVFDQFLTLYRPDCKTSYDNIDMVFHAIYPLLRHETHPDVRQRLLARLHAGIWEPEEGGEAAEEPPVSRSTHALYTFLYGGLADPPADDPVFRQAVEDGVCTLYRLERDRLDRTTKAGDQEAACLNRMGDPNAATIIPLEQRYYDNYVWRLDPYEIPTDHAAEPGLLHSPEDFLLAYWTGRYFGYVGETL